MLFHSVKNEINVVCYRSETITIYVKRSLLHNSSEWTTVNYFLWPDNYWIVESTRQLVCLAVFSEYSCVCVFCCKFYFSKLTCSVDLFLHRRTNCILERSPLCRNILNLHTPSCFDPDHILLSEPFYCIRLDINEQLFRDKLPFSNRDFCSIFVQCRINLYCYCYRKKLGFNWIYF